MAEEFKNFHVLAGTAATTLYTAGSALDAAIVIGCQAANTTTVNMQFSLNLVTTAGTATIVDEVTIPTQAALNPIGGKLVLEADDVLTVQTVGTADVVDVTLSVLELS